MGKTFRTITKEQTLLMERKVRRDADIEQGKSNFKHKVHKSAKSYNRSEYKRFEF